MQNVEYAADLLFLLGSISEGEAHSSCPTLYCTVYLDLRLAFARVQ